MNRLQLFPVSAKIENESLTIAGHSISTLADSYGTPLYLYDRETMDNAAGGYKSALASHYPIPASVTYAGKAYFCKAIAQWVDLHGLWADCTGEGEIAIARAGGVPREHTLVHGVNKSTVDLESAIQYAGTIVVDNLTELKRLSELFAMHSLTFPDLWLRLLPGVAVETHHAHTQTGQHDSKFGMTREEIMEAAQFCKINNLPLKGIHFHQGSNFRDASPLKAAIELGLDLAKEIGLTDDWHFSPGGGWGVAYHEDELPQPDIDEYVRVIAENVIEGCKARNLALPHLHLEPGRSLVARAGVAVYRVGAIKKRGDKIWVLTDGGMTDNPRHAMYGARYSCLTVSSPGAERSEKVSIAGPYCESGDVVIEDLPMPKIEPGALIAIPAAGAYHLSMSSNYNGSRKPAVLWLENGAVKLMQRRETIEDLMRRDENLF
ncbi:MAG: diaminopimelate decarboxylase [Anaerolineales bacterium]|uniref:diaminopimelate decarboxylase n=1 Tax=Candidatus Villigracilis proximus TaxID=3140683 RepID=UPI0031360324|nr:diaminopimelate decarboxylase [Anaerolineales bacterium]